MNTMIAEPAKTYELENFAEAPMVPYAAGLLPYGLSLAALRPR